MEVNVAIVQMSLLGSESAGFELLLTDSTVASTSQAGMGGRGTLLAEPNALGRSASKTVRQLPRCRAQRQPAEAALQLARQLARSGPAPRRAVRIPSWRTQSVNTLNNTDSTGRPTAALYCVPVLQKGQCFSFKSSFMQFAEANLCSC